MDSLSRFLRTYLMKTYRIPASRMIQHHQFKGERTNSTGEPGHGGAADHGGEGGGEQFRLRGRLMRYNIGTSR